MMPRPMAVVLATPVAIGRVNPDLSRTVDGDASPVQENEKVGENEKARRPIAVEDVR